MSLYDLTPEAHCQAKFDDYLLAQALLHVQRLINLFLEDERDWFLRCHPYQRTRKRAGYRNGYDSRYLETTIGTVRVRRPKVRGTEEPFRPCVLELYRRRQRKVDRTIVELVGRGLSTREATRALQRCFGTVVSAATVSNVVKQIDRLVGIYHQRPLDRGYRWVHLDAKHCEVSHRRKRRGRGKKKKTVVLLAFGMRYDGVSELIDYRVADKESFENWNAFLTDLEARGLRRRDRNNREFEMLISDGHMGLLGSMEMVWPTVPKQRCIFHKVQNIANHLQDWRNRKAILAQAGAIYKDLQSRRQAYRRLRRWSESWQELEPDAVRNFQMEFERTLTYLNAPPERWVRLKTNNLIERFIQELNRKIDQVRVFVNEESLDRTVFLTWQKLQANGYPETAAEDGNLFTRTS